MVNRTKREYLSDLPEHEILSSTVPRRALVVYLDTQDFNNLSSPRGEYEETLKYIEDQIRIGAIVVGHSYPLFFELIRKYDERHKEQRLRIARFINRICGKNAFPYPTDLASGARFPNDGIWLPRDAINEFSSTRIEGHIFNAIRESLKEDQRLNRQQRRLLGKRRGLQQALSQVPTPKLSKSDFPRLPISDAFIDGNYLGRFLQGSISRASISQEFTRWMTDPEYAMQIWYEYSGRDNPMERLVNDAYARLETGLHGYRTAFERLREARKELRIARASLHKLIHDPTLSPEMRELIKSRTSSRIDLDFEPKLDIGLAFGQDRTAHFAHYFKKLASGQANPQQSDIGDLLHLIYLLDVDLMRCDKRMAYLMSDCSDIRSDRIVPRLTDLRERIEEVKRLR